MCLESDEEIAVLRHKSNRPAISIPRNPTEDDLAFDWSLSEKDIRLILSHRGNENLCRFAVQLCILRKYGRFLPNYSAIPLAVLSYICQQLEIDPVRSLTGFMENTRGNTESDYQREIVDYLGWKFFDKNAKKKLQDWIDDQAAKHLYIENLVEKAENYLRQHKIVIPGSVIFEREVNSAYRNSEKMVFRTISKQIPRKTKAAIDKLLATPDNESKSVLFRFGEYPPEANAKHILRYLNRYQELSSTEIEKIRFSGISPLLLQKLATSVKTYNAWQLRRLDNDKKYALASCFLHEAKKVCLDYLVAMHSQFMTTMQRKSRNKWDKECRKLRKRAKKGMTALKKLAMQSLALREEPSATIDDLFATVDSTKIREAILDSNAFERVVDFGYLEQLHAHYSNFRRYFRFYVDLNFSSEPGSEHLINAIELLRKLNSSVLKKLPANVDTSFVPSAWLKAASSRIGGIDKTTWEIALAVELKEALNRGDVFLPDSRHHIAFSKLGYDSEVWEERRETAYAELGLPLDGQEATNKIIEEFDKTATLCEQGLPRNNFAEISGNKFKIKSDESIPEPPGTEELRQYIHRGLPKIRLEQVLMEVDALCGFSNKLLPLGRETPATGFQYQILMAAIVALATNLGITVMSESSTNNITVRMLQESICSRLREDTIRAANGALVNYHHSLETSFCWGDGTISSSDGQRFAVQESSLIATFYPRYFGYYDRAVSLYTHISNQYSIFNTKAISCAEREAPHVLDGVLMNDTNLNPSLHFTDTHGYTEQIFGLCYLLGLSFMPRISKFQKLKLYAPPTDKTYRNLDPIFSGTIDLNLIAEQWDPLVRVAASLKNRIVPASVIARKLTKSSSKIAKALSHLGRIVKTTYLLRYANDPELRQLIAIQLNRGEARNGLARRIFFADWGEFRSGDYFKIMNQASCLSLVSNAILIFNTIHIGKLLENAKKLGIPCTPEMVARISPLHHEHIIVNGTYDFSKVPRNR